MSCFVPVSIEYKQVRNSTIYDEFIKQYSYEICRLHHERFEGSGYPDGLKEEQIPICAQVAGLGNVYDALVTERPYKRKLEHEEAVRMIVMQTEWIRKVEIESEE